MNYYALFYYVVDNFVLHQSPYGITIFASLTK
jgi:hypothetical protein